MNVHGNNATTHHYDNNFYADVAYWLDKLTDHEIADGASLQDVLQVQGIDPVAVAAMLSEFTHAVGKTVDDLI